MEQQFRKITAIKTVRQLSGVGLKDAKELVEAYEAACNAAYMVPTEEGAYEAIGFYLNRRDDWHLAVNTLRNFIPHGEAQREASLYVVRAQFIMNQAAKDLAKA